MLLRFLLVLFLEELREQFLLELLELRAESLIRVDDRPDGLKVPIHLNDPLALPAHNKGDCDGNTPTNATDTMYKDIAVLQMQINELETFLEMGLDVTVLPVE